MNQVRSFLFIFLVASLLGACTKTEKIYVIYDAKNAIINSAGKDLVRYLSPVYPEKAFEISGKKVEGGKNIVLEISADAGLKNDESFKVTGNGHQLTISGKTPRGLLNGVYGLLEKLGYGFYLSFESAPPPQKGFDFTGLNYSDSPLVGERIVFNWHNFLSGCSAWDFQEWKDWIDRSSRMRFNTIMVHAYGNNPMFTYSFNGKEKKTSRLPATVGGRDYGTQQVNDVRRLHGGEVFDHPVFGAEVSQSDTGKQADAVQQLMGRVFDHAKNQGMKVCFSFDIDTYPANPQELINTLPLSAQFRIPLKSNNYSGRFDDGIFCMANPETPEGYAFYKSQIVSLLECYPQIDQIALWMRKEGSEWLSLGLGHLPAEWQEEFRKIEKQHPGLSSLKDAPGRFALGKVVAAFQKALKETGHEDVVLSAGSWAFGWMVPADVFFPDDIGFIGLDYNVLHGDSDIDLPEGQKQISSISQNRTVIPVFWAHHDDGAYMGRPYIPIMNLHDKLNRIGAGGFGIIHWTSWPLDPYFKNMALQVWENSRNQNYKTTIGKMAGDMFGMEEQEKTSSYLYEWAVSAPMFGRETREWFVDVEFSGQKVQQAEEGCGRRLQLLGTINEPSLTENGKKYLQYFKGLEEFSMEFYHTENAYQQSLKYGAEEKLEKAVDAIRQCRPEQLIARYARFSKEKGITKGEKGIIISLNLGWATYIENQRQALGENPIRCNFGPTVHPKFGQGLLRTNFFVDNEQNLWRNYGEKETCCHVYVLNYKTQPNATDPVPEVFGEICYSGIESDTIIRFDIQPMMADMPPFCPIKEWFPTQIRPGKYQLQLMFSPAFEGQSTENIQNLLVYVRHGQPADVTDQIDWTHPDRKKGFILKSYDLIVPEQGEIVIELLPVKGKANICGAVLKRKSS